MNRTSIAQQAKAVDVLPSTQGILQRKCACGNKTVAGGECAACAKKTSSLQHKLTIGSSNDPLEREADRVADQVMAMPTNSSIEKTPPRIQRFTEQSTSPSGTAPASVDRVLASSGRPLDPALMQNMEQRFGHDFSQVRVHTGSVAEQSTRDVNAHAYTAGHNVVFGTGQFSPGTYEGRKLIAHELTHVVQQGKGLRRNVIQRRSGCSAAQDTTITNDHTRARNMLSTAITAVSSYNGTAPTKVFNALSTHFHGATSNAFATWINVNLRFLWGTTWMAGYDCYTGGLAERVWACGPNNLATTFWCVPGVNIKLCPPYFGQSARGRSTTMNGCINTVVILTLVMNMNLSIPKTGLRHSF